MGPNTSPVSITVSSLGPSRTPICDLHKGTPAVTHQVNERPIYIPVFPQSMHFKISSVYQAADGAGTSPFEMSGIQFADFLIVFKQETLKVNDGCS